MNIAQVGWNEEEKSGRWEDDDIDGKCLNTSHRNKY